MLYIMLKNFMKDTNPKSYYQGYVEVFGKEAADKMVESSIKRTEGKDGKLCRLHRRKMKQRSLNMLESILMMGHFLF